MDMSGNKTLFLIVSDKTDKSQTEEDKYTTQVAETDAGMSSFESYPVQTSTIPSATRESEPGQRSFSNPGDSNTLMRQATVQRSMVTSDSGIPFYLKPSRYADYQDQKKRYDSFQTPKWLTDSKPDINLLVGCGFFFTGNNDLVRCYHCGIGLKDWVKEDDPLTEHVKYSSTCDFLIWRYGNSKVERMKAALTVESGNERESRPPPPSYPIRSPRYQTMEARLASFENLPSANNIHHQRLAFAGLFYTGQDDLSRCFTCDGGLKDWSPGDDPTKEHAIYFSNCHKINKLKGPEYVQLQKQSRSSNEAMGAEGGNKTPHQATEASPNLPIERMTLQENTDLVRCFHCGIGFKDGIKDDDPLTEHMIHSSTCNSLNCMHGKPNVERIKVVLTTVQGDLCRCFYCDGGLKDWSSGDEPIKEHAIYFPRCSNTNKFKGQRYVQLLQQDGLKYEHMCCGKDDIGGYYTLSQRSDRTGNITENSFEYTSVLRKSTKHIVLHMDPRLVLDEFMTCGFLTDIEIRDIEELQLTSEKNRAILRKVMTKGVNGYKIFKSALRESNQTLLLELLVQLELS